MPIKNSDYDSLKELNLSELIIRKSVENITEEEKEAIYSIIYYKYRDFLIKTAYQVTGDEYEATYVVDEWLTKLRDKKFPGFKKQGTTDTELERCGRAYFAKCIENLALRYKRRRDGNKKIAVFPEGSERMFDNPVPFFEPENTTDDVRYSKKLEIIQQLLDNESERNRLILLARFHGKTYNEIQTELQVSTHSIKGVVSRFKEKCRKIYREWRKEHDGDN